jgi:hypothetical protein
MMVTIGMPTSSDVSTLRSGTSPGRWGRVVADPVCPECRAGKHRNCDGDALDEATDEIVQCACGCHTFARLAEQAAHEDRG